MNITQETSRPLPLEKQALSLETNIRKVTQFSQ